MKVENYMTKQVITVKPGSSLQSAKNLMKANKIRHIPIVSDDEKLVGIISDRDIRKISSTSDPSHEQGEKQELLTQSKVDDVMAKHPISVLPDTPIEDAATLLRDEKIGALPVIHEGKLAGIISESDIFNAFTDLIRILRKKGISLEQLK